MMVAKKLLASESFRDVHSIPGESRIGYSNRLFRSKHAFREVLIIDDPLPWVEVSKPRLTIACGAVNGRSMKGAVKRNISPPTSCADENLSWQLALPPSRRSVDPASQSVDHSSQRGTVYKN